MTMDEHLYKIADAVKNFAVIYTVDNKAVPDFNAMYELYDACTVMFFWRYVNHPPTSIQSEIGRLICEM
jgi:DIM1 family U5 snRNP protein